MHSSESVTEVLALQADEGLGARRIARRTGLPLSTVRDWLAGRLPGNGVRPGTCTTCRASEHHFDELPPEYVYLLGLYLGDGSIASHPREVYRLRITLDVRYPGIIETARHAMAEIRGKASVARRRHEGCVEVNAYWRSWPCLFPQHGPGPKHARRIVLVGWQQELVDRWPEQLVRGLIHSDGCRFINTGRNGWAWPRYTFFQKSDDIRTIFCDACDRLGLRWTLSRPYMVYISRKKDVAKLDEFIGPKC
jgi:hypothetical protein